jgi:hypothetical protein
MTFNVLGAIGRASDAMTMRNALAPQAPQQQTQPEMAPDYLALALGGGPTNQAADFRAAIRAAESSGDYGVVNSLGYTGAYQFGQERLDDFNRTYGLSLTTDDLRTNPALQERVADWHFADIDRQLGHLAGASVNGLPLTQNALRAMAHLGGLSGARRYVRTGGRYDPADINDTNLSDYHRRFY